MATTSNHCRRNTSKYCSVYGCLNTSMNKPDLSFFQLPADLKRRNEWLRMICREDLADKNFISYKVCEEHFNEQDILPCQQVKRLKTTAIPTINLPYLLREDAETQTTDSFNAEPRSETVQTEKKSNIHKNTQTNKILLYRTATVKKLKRELGECQRQLRLNESSSKNPKIQRAILRKISDNLLSKQLGMIVKANIDLKCDEEYIQFCLNLYDASPAAYCFLRSTLAMPSPVTLMKLKTEIPNGPQTTTSTNTNNFTHTLYPSLLDFAATSDDIDERDAMNLEDFDMNSGGFDATTSNVMYADASTSTTTHKLLLDTNCNTSNVKTTTTTETNNPASSTEASSFLRSALSAAKSKTVKENNLEAKTSTSTNNSLAMIICDIPPSVPPEYYDPLENIM